MSNPADDISQAERRRILAEERLARNTYFGHAGDTELDLGGRFAKVTTTTVVGAGPVRYPRQPTGSPWACDPVPAESPLGLDINAMEPVGEPHEMRPQAAGDAQVPPSVARKFKRRF